MNKANSYFKSIPVLFRTFCKRYDTSMLDELGRGAGKGDGAGGPIREARGIFGKAREQDYFFNLRQKLLVALKNKLEEENFLRKSEIERHTAAIDENKKLYKAIDQKLDDCVKRKR